MISKLSLLLISIIVALIFLELLSHTSFFIKIISPQSAKTDNFTYIDSPLGEYGLRSYHLNSTKNPQTFRIVALGDSFTWGDKIENKDYLWPYVYEKELQNQTNRKVEVINLGKKAFTTVNEAELLEKIGWDYQPDLIILQFTLNDPLPSGKNFSHEDGSWLNLTKPLLPKDYYLKKYSFLYNLLNRLYADWQYNSDPKGYAVLYEDGFSGWEDSKYAIASISKSSGNKNINVILMIFPIFDQGLLSNNSYRYIEVHEKVAKVGRENGMEVLDLLPVYSKYNRTGRSWWSRPYDNHPSIEAHRIAGQKLSEFTIQNRLIPVE